MFYDRIRKRWPFNTGGCLTEVIAWAGLTVYRMHFCSSNKCIANIIIKYKSHKKDPLPQICSSTNFNNFFQLYYDDQVYRWQPVQKKTTEHWLVPGKPTHLKNKSNAPHWPWRNNHLHHVQTCIKRSSLGQRKNCLLRQVTS